MFFTYVSVQRSLNYKTHISVVAYSICLVSIFIFVRGDEEVWFLYHILNSLSRLLICMYYAFKLDCEIRIIAHLSPDVHQGTLDKQLYRVEKKYSMAEKKLQEQKKKERQNKVRLHWGL